MRLKDLNEMYKSGRLISDNSAAICNLEKDLVNYVTEQVRENIHSEIERGVSTIFRGLFEGYKYQAVKNGDADTVIRLYGRGLL